MAEGSMSLSENWNLASIRNSWCERSLFDYLEYAPSFALRKC